jgi:WD40 repeat protein
MSVSRPEKQGLILLSERKIMKLLHLIVLFATITTLAACQPAEPQPVFTPSAEATASPIPLPATAPKVVAKLSGVIWSFDLSPDGSTIAIATSKGLEIYDLKNFALLKSLEAGISQFDIAWSPDGKKLAAGVGLALAKPTEYSGGEAVLRVWDTSTWKIVLETNFAGDMVNERILDIAWKPDGLALALSTDIHGVMVVDAASGKLLSQQTGFASSVMEAAWSPDGSRLVSTSDMAYSLRRWKVDTGEAVRLFDQRVSNPWHVIWMPDGKRIISGHVYGTVCFWTVATNKCDGFIQTHRTAVFSMAVTSDGTRLATGGGVIRIWDTANGKLLTAFGEDSKIIYNHLEWAPGDQVVISMQTNMDDPEMTALRLWNVSTGIPSIQFQGGKR